MPATPHAAPPREGAEGPTNRVSVGFPRLVAGAQALGTRVESVVFSFVNE